MLPTISEKPVYSNRPPITRDINDLDSLLSELNTPKEVITSTPQQSGSGQTSPEQSHIEKDIFSGGGNEDTEPMPEEIARLSGKTIANTIDMSLGTGMSLYAKNTNPEKYQATPKQLENLEDACTAVAKKYNYRVEDSPWFNLIILIVAIYLPKAQEAKYDRLQSEVRQMKVELKREIDETRAELDALKKEKEQSKQAA